jgi:hypothetical protein
MRIGSLCFITGVCLVISCSARLNHSSDVGQKIKVLLVTGGHEFEHIPFYNVFDSIAGITYDTMAQPGANVFIASPAIEQYDVLVFYDMADSLSASQQQAYLNLLNKGKAMIFLHHALVSYQNWSEFIRIVGGQYHRTPVIVNGDTLRANYEHDVLIPVKVEDGNHPVTRGIDSRRGVWRCRNIAGC